MMSIIDPRDNPPAAWFGRLEFTLGVASSGQLPADNGREVAFAGRSNAGKSSAINRLTGRKALARISKRPGRTRELNYFSYDAHTHIVDMPGYGFARVDAGRQDAWARLADHYLRTRRALRGVFLIMDARHPGGKLDRQMLDYCLTAGLPAHILLNKADKLSRCQAALTLRDVQKSLAPETMSAQLFSALNGEGLAAARDRLARWLFAD